MNNNADNIINIKSHFIFRAEFDKYFCLLFKPIYIPIRRSKKIFDIYKKTYVLINYLQIYNCGDTKVYMDILQGYILGIYT